MCVWQAHAKVREDGARRGEQVFELWPRKSCSSRVLHQQIIKFSSRLKTLARSLEPVTESSDCLSVRGDRRWLQAQEELLVEFAGPRRLCEAY